MAPTILWDASGLAKRYIAEIGSQTVDVLFGSLASSMFITSWGYLETYAILRRRFNAKAFDADALTDAVTALQAGVISGSDFELISISDAMIFSASSLIDAHNLNSSDAAILAAYLDFQLRLPMSSLPCLLVASDKRLLRAASAEGLQTLDPENLLPGEVPAFVAGL